VGRDRWTTRLTVEQCPIFLDVQVFRRSGALKESPGLPRELTWKTSENGATVGHLRYRVTQEGPSGLALYFPPQLVAVNGLFIPDGGDQLIALEAVRPHLGGVRYWLKCECGKRAGRLYLLVAAAGFRCRRCANLTYRSAQRHDARKDALCRNPALLGAALRSRKPRRRTLGMGAFTQQLRREQKRGW